MIDQYFGTSGTYVLRIPEDPTFRVTTSLSDQTLGDSAQFFAPLITRNASSVISKVQNKEMVRVAQELLDAIEQSAFAHVISGGEINHLAPVKASLPDDGSVLLEWTNPDFRLGFNIEPNIDESGWYIITSERLGDIGANGLLSSINVNDLAAIAVRFLKANT